MNFAHLKDNIVTRTLNYAQMSQAGGRTTHMTDDNTRPSVHHRRAPIDLLIFVDLSRLVPPNIILAESRQSLETPSLTDFPLMHFVQTLDLLLEIDEIQEGDAT